MLHCSQEEYPELEQETAEIIFRSALPRAAKQILTSLPEETADGRSATEIALQDAVQSAVRLHTNRRPLGH